MSNLRAVAKDKISDAFSTWLDFFRWLAAFAVLITHAEGRLLISIADLPPSDREYAHYAFAFLGGFAHQAVIIFFVISGFLVGGGLWQEAKSDGTIDLIAYLIKRTVRLWTVLIPALVVTLLCATLCVFLFDGLRNDIFQSGIFSRLSASSFLCNAVFLQNAACSEYGDNDPLWSLYNEFWYYLIWPAILLALLPILSTKKRLGCAILSLVGLLVLTFAQFPQLWFGPYMCIWLLGVLVAVLERPIVKSPMTAGCIFVILLVAIRLIVRREFFETQAGYVFIIDLATAATFSNLLLSLKCNKGLASPIGNGIHSTLAGFSFSLYCIHTPILLLYVSVLMHYFGIGFHMRPNGPVTWVIVTGALTTSVLFAYGFSLLTEARTGQIRRRIFDGLHVRQRATKFHFTR